MKKLSEIQKQSQTCLAKEPNLKLRNSKRIQKTISAYYCEKERKIKQRRCRKIKILTKFQIIPFNFNRKGFTGTEGARAGRVRGPIVR